MLESSVTAGVFKWLWNELKQSKFFGVLMAVTAYFAYAYKYSTLRKIILGVGNVENYTETSVFYRILSSVCNFFVNLFTKIASFFINAAKGSLIAKFYANVVKGSFIFDTNNFFALCIMFIFLVPHDYWNNMYALAAALMLCGVYVFCLALGKDFGKDIKGVPFQLLLFLFSLFLSAAISFDIADSIRILVFFATSYLLCLAVYGTIRDENRFESFCRIIYFTLLAAALFGIAQRIMGVEADASFTDLTLNKDMPGRVFGTMGNPNNYAEYLMAFLPYAFSFAMTRKTSDNKMFCLIGLILPLAAMLTTYSRSSWIALACSCVLYVFIFNFRLVPVFAAGVICMLPFIPQSIYNRILTIGNVKDSSSSYRITIWTGVLKMLKEYWFTGIGLGPGAFATIFPKYALGDTAVARHSHMQFMEMLVEGGVLSFFAYIWMLVSLVKRCCHKAVTAKNINVKYYACAAASSVTGIALIGMFEYCWFYPRVMFAFFISVGLCLAVLREK